MDKLMKLSAILKKMNPEELKIVAGFDGFVDEIIHVVDKRSDSKNFNKINTIKELGTRIRNASGLSTNIELIPIARKIGGNGPIMCNALWKHNTSIVYIGALGSPSIDDVFKEMGDKLYSIAKNGQTDALEFDDGKLMLGKMQSLNDVTYENLLKAVGKEKFVSLLSNTDLFAAVNWSMLPNLADLLDKVADNILPLLPKGEKKPIYFMDLADPEKREDEEINKALLTLKKYKNNFFVVLGLNKKEAYDIANVLSLFDEESLKKMQISIEELNIALQKELEIDCIVIHPRDRASCVINNKFYMEKGPFTSRPRLSTGAGDNFNAGFLLGLLLGLTPDQALLTGMSTSGYYVRNAKSPNLEELCNFMEDWAKDNIG